MRQPLHHAAHQAVQVHQLHQQLDVDRAGFRRPGPRGGGSAGEVRGQVQAGDGRRELQIDFRSGRAAGKKKRERFVAYDVIYVKLYHT